MVYFINQYLLSFIRINFYLKVILRNHNGVYKYKFTPNARQQLVPPGVNLNPSGNGIPTLTFWQTIL